MGRPPDAAIVLLVLRDLPTISPQAGLKRIVVVGLSILGTMAEYEEIANISAGIGRDIAKRD